LVRCAIWIAVIAFTFEKESAFPPRQRFRMSDDVLEAYVQRYIAAQPAGAGN